MIYEPIAIWCSLFAYAGRQVSAYQFATAAHLLPFVKAGWLVPAARASTTPCEICDEPHWADIELIDEEQKGICRRNGEAFTISRPTFAYRVDGDAFSRSLAQTLNLDGSPRRIRGIEKVWSLGVRRLNEVRVAFFCTPSLGRVDLATTILSSVADQSRSTAHCLLVADEIDAIRLLRRKSLVVRLRDVATISPAGTLTIDNAQLMVATFPDISEAKRSGRPAEQRERILLLLDECGNSGPIDTSNESIRRWGLKYESRFERKRPAPDTIRKAIAIWNARRGFQSSSS